MTSKNSTGEDVIRDYHTPASLNKDATKVRELIDWDKEQLHEPVQTLKKTTNELQDLLKAPMKISYLPVHGQSFERAVKLVTEAAGQVYGFERRDGFVRVRVAHRGKMPENNSKQDLVKLLG